MTNYTLISKFRNKQQCQLLVSRLLQKGKTCYDFCNKPVGTPNTAVGAEAYMQALESAKDFYVDPYFQQAFQDDLNGLKNAETAILLLPAGTSAHIEAGIAYGLGKHLILIGEPEKPETHYLIFDERYRDIEEFLATV